MRVLVRPEQILESDHPSDEPPRVPGIDVRQELERVTKALRGDAQAMVIGRFGLTSYRAHCLSKPTVPAFDEIRRERARGAATRAGAGSKRGSEPADEALVAWRVECLQHLRARPPSLLGEQRAQTGERFAVRLRQHRRPLLDLHELHI